MAKELLIFIALLPVGFFRENGCMKDKSIILWTKERKLEWKDFKGHSSDEAHSFAGVSVRLKLDYYYDDYLQYDVMCVMEKNTSWSIDNSELTLRHEQGHFDIGELYARKLRKAIFDNKAKINKKSLGILDSLYYLYGEKMKKEQEYYDKETARSGVIRDGQHSWDHKIIISLDSLRRFVRNDDLSLKWKKNIKEPKM